MLRVIPRAPRFDGDLAKLAEFVVANLLPEKHGVERFHEELLRYCASSHPLFVVRTPSPTKFKRGTVARTRDGCRVRFSDNAPAWHVHHTLFHGRLTDLADFDAYVAALSTHFFEVRKRIPKSVNEAGWYVAHLYPVRDRRLPFELWCRPDVVRRFTRNIHPCNLFYVPLEVRHLGENADVIAFFAERLKALYGPVWEAFRCLADGEPLGSFSAPEVERVARASRTPRRAMPAPKAPPGAPKNEMHGSRVRVVSQYRYSRLCFKRDIIEPLADDQYFEVVTPNGTFRMSKREFATDFAQVARTASYREGGVYHFAKAPRRALKYLVSDGC